MRTAHDPTIVATDSDLVAVALDRHGARTLEQSHATPQEVVFKHGSNLRVLAGKHLLATHHKRHVCAKRREHVHELNTRNTRANHGHARWEHLGWVAIARGENTFTIGMAPVGDTRTRARSNKHGVGFKLLNAFGCGDFDHVRTDESSRTHNHPDTLTFEQPDGVAL